MLIIGDASYRRQIKDKVVEVSGPGRSHPIHRGPRRVFDWAELGEISLRLEVRSCPWGTFWRFLWIGHFLRLGRQLRSRIPTDIPTLLFRNLKYDSIVAYASIGGILLLNDSCVADYNGCTIYHRYPGDRLALSKYLLTICQHLMLSLFSVLSWWWPPLGPNSRRHWGPRTPSNDRRHSDHGRPSLQQQLHVAEPSHPF